MTRWQDLLLKLHGRPSANSFQDLERVSSAISRTCSFVDIINSPLRVWHTAARHSLLTVICQCSEKLSSAKLAHGGEWWNSQHNHAIHCHSHWMFWKGIRVTSYGIAYIEDGKSEWSKRRKKAWLYDVMIVPKETCSSCFCCVARTGRACSTGWNVKLHSPVLWCRMKFYSCLRIQ